MSLFTGHFSAAESFKGQLTRLNLWSRVLSEQEVNEVMNSCIGAIGDLVAWADFYTGIHGFVKVVLHSGPEKLKKSRQKNS